MLCDWREYTTAKQAQTAAHQFGAPGVLSELYGVTNWDFDFAGHKAQGDWQAALGITVRVPHLAWAGMEGEAKRDYPASIFYQSPWFAEYHLVEDHFARVNTVLTRGKPGVRIGVIHPIESFWLSWGPVEANALVREDQETAFASLADWLLHGLIDFDYICESLLPSQCPLPKAKMSEFRVGKMKYDAIVVPPMRTIRSSTLDRLEKFSGAIIFAGDVPMLVDAVPDDRAQRLAARSTRIAFRRAQVLQALDPFRDVEVFGSQSLLHQLRLDGKNRQLFFCNTDVLKSQDCTIRVRGHWGVMERNTLTGQSRPLNADCSGGWTRWQHHFDAHGHLLLTLEPGAPNKNDPSNRADSPPMVECGRLKGPVPVTLSEPNVLLLDLAEWCLDRGPWQAEEEILRVDNLVRSRLGLPPRTGNVAQPWTDKEPMPDLAEVGLRYRLFCESPVDKPSLALEQPDGIRILLDGKPVASKVSGHWVDPAIKTLRLPSLSRGHHSLEIFRPFHRRSGLEAAYLLGDFGVQLAGREVKIVAPVRHLAFGDFTRQGLPFYTGNVTYHCTVNGNNHPAELAFAWPRAFRLQVLSQNERQQSGILPRTRIPLIKVKLDGKDRGAVAFAPFRRRRGRLKPGKHPLDITCFGNRFNVFGSLHNLNQEHLWAETCPDAWRTNGADWTYEYQIRPMGILNSPAILAPQW
jgi:hypothetical protein